PVVADLPGAARDAQRVAAESAADTLTTPPNAVPPLGSLAPPNDMAAAGNTTAIARLAALRIDAPDSAAVSVNGARVGRGYWAKDSLPPGMYTVGAILPAVDGCIAARQSRRIRVLEGETTRVTLRPRACGYLIINAGQPGADYTITALIGGGEPVSGRLVRAEDQVLLPEGTYRLRVSAPGCESYTSDSIRVAPIEASRKWFRLDCGSSDTSD
ncbi:MAG: carboxypeptidase-like regulatory domain-containing protein, partial [Gemmatimonadota bacterium]|nr:carboxypeptidase-like regulatory domain-containing protein [Gemmatimonadota bacterium]